jgi:hypothetical protein
MDADTPAGIISTMMDILKATKRYEAWLATELTIVEPDLKLKHDAMSAALFPFFRATYYRWAQLWPEVCGDLASAPQVLAVGDLHVENFGTWRDSEGRLIWGVNDFDETWPLSYTNDLVRLAASAQLAIAENHLAIAMQDAARAILEGYTEWLVRGGCPFVLAEYHAALREMAVGPLVPARASRGGKGQPGPAAVRGAGRMGRRQDRAGSQGHGPVGLLVGVRSERLVPPPVSADSGYGGALLRSLRETEGSVDRAPPGAGLFAHRTLRAAQGAR